MKQGKRLHAVNIWKVDNFKIKCTQSTIYLYEMQDPMLPFGPLYSQYHNLSSECFIFFKENPEYIIFPFPFADQSFNINQWIIAISFIYFFLFTLENLLINARVHHMSIYKLFPLFLVLSESETLLFMLIALHAFFRIINFHWCIYILHFFLDKLMASIASTFCCFLNQFTVTIHTKLFVCSSFFFSQSYILWQLIKLKRKGKFYAKVL